MNSEDVKVIRALLTKEQKIVIIPHKNPDGDAIGSCLGLWHYFKNKGLNASVIVPNDYPKFLKWMPGTEDILNFEKQNTQAMSCLQEATICFTLDFNDLSRVGQLTPFLEKSTADFIMIDHHRSPDNYAKIMYSDPEMSSTCEMVYHFIKELDGVDKINEEIANCLYSGIVTDTGSFKFAATTSTTHRTAATLMDRGANNALIQNEIFDTNSPERLKLLGCALNNMVILKEFQTAYTSLSQAELDEHNYKKGDTEGFVNYGLTLENVKFAVIFIENTEENIIKISFRSQGDFSVNEFARAHFQGGGHTNAAGGKSDSDLSSTISTFRELLNQYKDELKQ